MMNSVQQYLKYAHVQMAAEAFIIDPVTGNARFSGSELETALKLGNRHASIFTPTLATEFAAEWDVIAHKPNTTTGFSGTLFKHKNTHEYVLSFRSTEFIDDQINDSEVTNKGIKDTGWAFGQIADMWDWWESEVKDVVGATGVTLTGYSLGAHLSNALYQLLSENGDQNLVNGAYTFNGAGSGGINDGHSLTEAVTQFKETWEQPLAGGGFSDPTVKELFLELVAKSAGDLTAIDQARALALIATPGVDTDESGLLYKAVEKVIFVQDAIDYVNGLDGVPTTFALGVAGAKIEYWVGALRAAQLTSGVGGLDMLDTPFSRQDPVGRENWFNLFGYETASTLGKLFPDEPSLSNLSAVANSQTHYGTDVPVYIESQPLARGTSAVQIAASTRRLG